VGFLPALALMMRGTKYNHKFYFRKTLRDNAQVPSRKPDYRAE
jgi:hypothetical protein